MTTVTLEPKTNEQNNESKKDYSEMTNQELLQLSDEEKKNKIGIKNIGDSQIGYATGDSGHVLIKKGEGLVVSIKAYLSRMNEKDQNGNIRWKKVSPESILMPEVTKLRTLNNGSDDSIDEEFIESLESIMSVFEKEQDAKDFLNQTDSRKTLRTIINRTKEFENKESKEWILRSCMKRIQELS